MSLSTSRQLSALSPVFAAGLCQFIVSVLILGYHAHCSHVDKGCLDGGALQDAGAARGNLCRPPVTRSLMRSQDDALLMFVCVQCDLDDYA